MKTINVIIEPGKDGFGVMFKTKGLEDYTSFGETLKEAKKNARAVLADMQESFSDDNMPEALMGFDPATVKMKFSFMLNHYFKEYKYINVSGLAARIGINSSLLRQYDKGLAMASENKYIQIREGLHEVGRELKEAL